MAAVKKGGYVSGGVGVTVNLISDFEQKIKVHNEMFFLVLETDADFTDGYFQIEPIDPSDKSSTAQITTDCDPVQLDSTKVSPYKILSKGDSITYNFELSCFYNLLPGHSYRVRFYYKLSKYNPSLKDVYSDWLTIKI
ncbi:MAG TPA: hypothetical protein VHZ50_01035 [Puia sp.]|nr:hypothetical protein [Puia sp.]